MRDLVFLGMPGSGKGTQASIVTDQYPEYSHVSTWDIYRALMSQHNAIGLYAKERIDQWKLVEDNVTISLFEAYFYTVHNQGRRMLLDGYPRTIPQLRDLFRLATLHNRSLMGIYLSLPDEVAVERILARARPGETEEIIRVRLQEFHQHTAPILEEFKKEAPLYEIVSDGSIEEVASKIREIVVTY